ncbi:MAG: response regulator [Chloroflexi bacterium]|nr:response regulator [Chloroflexota bacterium]
MAKVLIVDDAAFMRMRCAKMLTESGHEVIEASDGIEAVQKYQECRPNAVLMDITMPNMDGIAALKRLKEIDPGVKVAMVTAMGQQSMVIEAMKSGARDFVVKPFDASRVKAAVQRLVG